MVRKNTKYIILFIIPGLITLLNSCKVGPNYQRPVMKMDSLYRFAQNADTNCIANVEWIRLFKDTVLQQLVKTGLEKNYDIRTAFARIEEARANFKIARGQQSPQVNASASGGWNRQPLATAGIAEYSSWQATAGLTWEIDLWGKLRRSKEAARANLFGQIAYQQSVRITLIYEIVSNYFDLLEFDNELKIVRDNIIIREKSLALVKAKMIAGTASGLVVAQAEAELALARTEVPKLDMQIGEKENYLSTLLGDAPHVIKRGRPMLDQINIPEIKTPGIPSQLIVRRPDIIMAEQTLVAANANIGVARAMMLPSLNLSGDIGAVFNPTTMIYNAVGNLVAPIFGGGQLRAGVKKAKAQKEQMLYTYLQTINTSLKEVSNALLEVKKQQEIVQSQQVTVNAAQTSFELSDQLYNAGYASYLDVINAQSLLFSSQINLSQAQINELTAIITLYSALGGGWK
ncbi:MAG: efflux transporter outer membrane subunit [Bacteroidales bacterium]|jgi:multidrug efflux system outer membrane protein|nr:efflux transporter outer membrane subunit [Bacteroidales bacterium]